MQYKTIITIGISVITSFSILHASGNAEKLFTKKCMVCHVKIRPDDTSKLMAPPISGVLNHVKQNFASEDKAVKFIVDYVLNPTREKAVCMPENIKKFGLMPSQNGAVSKDELEEIAEWLYKNFPPKGMVKTGREMHSGKQDMMNGKEMGKKGVHSCENSKQKKKFIQKNTKPQKDSPFLITKGLPHLTMMVKKNWDKLNLSDNQKAKLLQIRKDTMAGVKEYAPKVKKLEKRVKKMILKGENPKDIYPLIDKLANAKAELTKVHARCIYNTKKTLTKEQLLMLLSASKHK